MAGINYLILVLGEVAQPPKTMLLFIMILSFSVSRMTIEHHL